MFSRLSIHPLNWMRCTDVNVFGGATNNPFQRNRSPGPAQGGVLQRVIEYTNITIIDSGNLDMLLPTNGPLLAIQNMTWNVMQGFRAYPNSVFHVPDRPEYNGSSSLVGAGRLGYWESERDLTFYQVQLAGHGESLGNCLAG